MKNILTALMFAILLSGSIACSKLNEQILDGTEQKNISTATNANITTIEQNLSNFLTDLNFLSLGEVTSDALCYPVRGADWGENGQFTNMHLLKYSSQHVGITDAYNAVFTSIYNCDQILNGATSQTEKNQAYFYKAYFYYYALSYWGKVLYRELGSELVDNAKVYTGKEATELAISWLENILPNMPDKANDASLVTKDAINFLLAKFYLNKVVFVSNEKKETYTFNPTDMNQVVKYVNNIKGSALLTSVTNVDNIYGVDDPYWLSYAPNNSSSNEIIFSLRANKSLNLDNYGSLASAIMFSTLHYGQVPVGSGWNGGCIVTEFYNKFDITDKRRSYSNTNIISKLGNAVGLREGQMYNPGGTEKIMGNRNSHIPLIFTKEINSLFLTGADLECIGVRPVRYIIDWENLSAPKNDLVVFIYSDAMLMKAEAILRGATVVGDDAQSLIDKIRNRAGLSTKTADLNLVYDERGKELWFRGTRREDMLRFGTFLKPRQLKPYQSENKYLLFPLPVNALLNTNLNQNEGY